MNIYRELAALWILVSVNGTSAPGPDWRADIGQGKADISFTAVGQPSALTIRGALSESKSGARPYQGKFQRQGNSIHGVALVDLSALTTGIDLRDRHMKEKYLELAKYPNAILNVSKLDLTPAGSKEGRFEGVPFSGELLLHGMKHPISGKADVEEKGGEVSLALRFPIKLTQFGIALPSYLGILVSENVDVVATVAVPREGT